MPAPNAVFDEGGNFLLVPGLLGIKVGPAIGIVDACVSLAAGVGLQHLLACLMSRCTSSWLCALQLQTQTKHKTHCLCCSRSMPLHTLSLTSVC